MSDVQRRLEFFRLKYSKRQKKLHVTELQSDYKVFRELVVVAGRPDDNKLLEDLYYQIQTELKRVDAELRNDCPIAFVKPSWAQAQMLNAWHPEFEPEFAPEGYQSLLDVSSVRVGKDLMNGTLVATPSGYTPIEELRVGDSVLGSDGRATKVTGVFPQGVRQMHRIEFSDNTTAYCSETHLWDVIKQGELYNGSGKPSTMTTRDIIAWNRGEKPDSRRRLAIPKTPVAEFVGSPLPLDPWLLGVIIGDGCICGSGTITVTTPDKEIVDGMIAISAGKDWSVKPLKNTNGMAFGLSGTSGRKNEIKRALDLLEMYGKRSKEKSIPPVYKTASEVDRIALVQGLMDTDGFCSKNGYSIFYTTSTKLAEDFAEVVRSLGCHAIIRQKRGRYKGEVHLSWLVGIHYSPFPLFRLSKKRVRAEAKPENGKHYHKFINRISQSVPAASTCISVEAEDGLFLLRDGIVTHNSFGLFMNMILWMIPNDPDWPLFDEYEHPTKGKYRVYPRWDWDEYQRSGRKVVHRDEPPKSSCENWLGCVDENHYLLKVTPALQKLFPKKYVLTRPDGQLAWYKSEKFIETKFGSRMVAKLYNSDMTAWSGAELFITGFDEGPPEDKVDETVFRTNYIHIAFTPRDPANLGPKAALAKKIASGKKKMVGKLKVFQFKMSDTEDFVLGQGNEKLGAKKKAERIAIAGTMGDAGKVAVEGGFFDSSPLVFNHFDAAMNVLPVTADLVVRAIRDELNVREKERFPWLEKFSRANIIRGFDEGLAHPTSAVWMALLKTGEKVVYRDYEASDTSITDRCERIIDLSGNERRLVDINQMIYEGRHDQAREQAEGVMMDERREKAIGQKVMRYREIWKREPIRRTFADSKIFKRDPEHPLDGWTENYRRAGLTLERGRNDGPAARCDFVNNLFRTDHTRTHLNPAQGGEDSYGCGLYITRDCVKLRERIENYLWEQFKSGPRMGQFTGKPGALDDDLTDALGYAATARINWMDPENYVHSAAHT